jgi:hypothetical protein
MKFAEGGWAGDVQSGHQLNGPLSPWNRWSTYPTATCSISVLSARSASSRTSIQAGEWEL